MISRLSSVQDIHSGDRVPGERVRQFDESFDKESKQVRRIGIA